jgi:hypothetical protein
LRLFKEEKLISIISYLIIPHQFLTLTKANAEEAPIGPLEECIAWGKLLSVIILY